jgi:heme exporter protein D
VDSLRSVLAMGGYAHFVWPAYGVALAVLGGLTVAAIRRLRRSQADLAQLEAELPRRRHASAGMAAEEAS